MNPSAQSYMANASSTATNSQRPTNGVPGRGDVAFAGSGNNWLKALPDLLRGAGALAVLFALNSFFLKAGTSGDDLFRYFTLLGNTAVLVVMALGIGHYFKEGKGPRLLLTLALVSVPINYAILGGFIFYVSGDLPSVEIPSYVKWQVESTLAAGATTALATCVLLPVIWLGFRTLSRGMSASMSLLYVFSNAALLLPLRDPNLIFALSIGLGVLTLWMSGRTVKQQIEVKTKEGRMALLLQFLPLGILVGRNIWLYSADDLVLLAASGLTFMGLRQASQLLTASSLLKMLLNLCAAGTAIFAGLFASEVTAQFSVLSSIALLPATLLTAVMFYDLSRRADGENVYFRFIAVAIAVGGCLLNQMIAADIIASTMSLLIGVALLVSSYMFQQRFLSIGGLLLAFAGLADQCIHLFSWFDFGYWMAIAFVGIAAIVLASVLETRGVQMRRMISHYGKRMGEWSY